MLDISIVNQLIGTVGLRLRGGAIQKLKKDDPFRRAEQSSEDTCSKTKLLIVELETTTILGIT